MTRQAKKTEEPEAPEIIYPETDGEPMGETELHVVTILHLFGALRYYFKDVPDIYVIADMFLYYEEGKPSSRKAPDVMVVKGADRRVRRIYKLWEEKVAPCVIIEVTSKSTCIEDLISKSFLYARLGVKEYFLYDPLGDYLEQPLQGFRLKDGIYELISLTEDGTISSEELGVVFRPIARVLHVIDPQSGQSVPGLVNASEILEAERRRAKEAEEHIEAARQEARRAAAQADQAQKQAMEAQEQAEQARQQAEQAQKRAEQAQQQTEQARQQAEQERLRAEAAEKEMARLKAKLEGLERGKERPS
ncbi:MAG: Uma2 family endonuclease [Armatimonadetes bacterium]|nr:Uma2 family endonuclease [Armatimonadota bacterium]